MPLFQWNGLHMGDECLALPEMTQAVEVLEAYAGR
jgi:hypothetical protein